MRILSPPLSFIVSRIQTEIVKRGIVYDKEMIKNLFRKKMSDGFLFPLTHSQLNKLEVFFICCRYTECYVCVNLSIYYVIHLCVYEY